MIGGKDTKHLQKKFMNFYPHYEFVRSSELTKTKSFRTFTCFKFIHNETKEIKDIKLPEVVIMGKRRRSRKNPKNTGWFLQ